MLPKTNSLINQVLTRSNYSFVNIARTAFYIEIFEGSIYDWKGTENSGATPAWKKHNTSKMHINIQQGQSRTCSAILPLSDFRTNSLSNLNYNADTGIYTNKVNPASAPTWLNISKGFLLRGYVGYKDFEPPYADNVLKRFTGVIDSIVVNDESGTLEINAVDFSVIFMNSLNYNYPDINSYRDVSPIDSTLTLPTTIPASGTGSDSPITQTFASSSHGFVMGDKLKIDSEIFLVINVVGAVVKLQRLAAAAGHNAGAKIYLMDGLVVGPEDVYDNRLLSKYVPAYDNWRLTDAVRDICIKAKFPTDMISFSYSDKENMRLGASEKYPFMKSKTIFETMKQQYIGPNKSFTAESYDSQGQISYESKIEKKVYLGLDDEALNEAKFKFEFGKTLWDCLVSMCEGFGFRLYFDDNGVLTIKSVRQYEWVRPAEDTDEDHVYIENHCWFWKYWDIATKSDHRYSVDFTPMVDKPYVIKARFISKEEQTNPMDIKLQHFNGSSWIDVTGDLITIPSLQPYQFFEVLLYTRSRDTTPFVDGQYGVLKVNSFTNPPMFNGFLYLDTLDETVSYDVDSRYNAQVKSMQNTATDVRNQMTIIGQPKAPIPIVSRVQDTASMYGGMPCLAMITEDTIPATIPINYLRGDRNNFFADGKYDTYATLKTLTKTITFKTMSLAYFIKRAILFIKPQTTPIGTTITFYNGVTQIATHTIDQDDLGSGGCVFNFAASYSEVILRASMDLEISEIECYDSSQAYNFVGFKKETLVVKANISDKATSDWVAYTQLEMHRKNTKTVDFTAIGNPYLEVGDCITIAAPEVGTLYDIKLWSTGVSIEVAIDSYIDTVTVSAIAPMQSYMIPPAPDGNAFPPTDAYDFSISKYKVGVQGDIPVTTFYSHIVTGITSILHKDDGAIEVASLSYTDSEGVVTSFVPYSLVRLTNSETNWVEYVYISNIDVPGKRLIIADPTTDRGRNNTVAAYYTVANTNVEQYAVMPDFTGGDDFLTFNFAIPVSKKVQIVVGVRHINQTLAYVMEEKILTAGVYKRENGIRWDGGLNFAKVWPESVDKIYLPPNESFNYMYNRMFNPGSTSNWENPNNNFYWWEFDQDLQSVLTAGTNIATASGWRKTPYQYNATLILRPVLSGYTGPTTNIPTVTKDIDIKTKCPTYKLRWGAITPDINYLSEFPVVSCSVKIEKIFNGTTTISEFNDAIYFDTYVMGENGENPNITAGAGSDTARRWVSPIGLVSMLTWDFTDSQGRFVGAKYSPAATKYKFGIVNAFDIYGEGVEIKRDEELPKNLVDGTIKAVETIYTINGISYNQPVAKLVATGTWCVCLSPDNVSYQTNSWVSPLTAVKGVTELGRITNLYYTSFSYNFEKTAGQQNDGFLKIGFDKQNITTPWQRTEKRLYIQSALNIDYQTKAAEPKLYFRFFYKPYERPMIMNGVIPLTNITIAQLFNPWLNIMYLDKAGVRQEYNLKIPNRGSGTEGIGNETDNNNWYSAYISFNIADIPSCDIIKGISLEFRPCDKEIFEDVPALLQARFGSRAKAYLGLDSFELAVKTDDRPSSTYLEPSGPPRISDLFTLYN